MLMAGFPKELVLEESLDAFEQRSDFHSAAQEIRIDYDGDPRRYRKRDTVSALEQQLDRRGRKAEPTKPRVAADRHNVILAILGVRAAAAWRRHEAFCDQVSNLTLGDARNRRKLANVQGAALFRQDLCRKLAPR